MAPGFIDTDMTKNMTEDSQENAEQHDSDGKDGQHEKHCRSCHLFLAGRRLGLHHWAGDLVWTAACVYSAIGYQIGKGKNMKRRVVVTGMGAITPIGNDVCFFLE